MRAEEKLFSPLSSQTKTSKLRRETPILHKELFGYLASPYNSVERRKLAQTGPRNIIASTPPSSSDFFSPRTCGHGVESKIQ